MQWQRVTGLWQVSGRNSASFDRVADLDLHYIENWSLRMDAQILAKTFSAVLSGRGGPEAALRGDRWFLSADPSANPGIVVTTDYGAANRSSASRLTTRRQRAEHFENQLPDYSWLVALW